jgi:hypothetical protein
MQPRGCGLPFGRRNLRLQRCPPVRQRIQPRLQIRHPKTIGDRVNQLPVHIGQHCASASAWDSMPNVTTFIDIIGE